MLSVKSMESFKKLKGPRDKNNLSLTDHTFFNYGDVLVSTFRLITFRYTFGEGSYAIVDNHDDLGRHSCCNDFTDCCRNRSSRCSRRSRDDDDSTDD